MAGCECCGNFLALHRDRLQMLGQGLYVERPGCMRGRVSGWSQFSRMQNRKKVGSQVLDEAIGNLSVSLSFKPFLLIF